MAAACAADADTLRWEVRLNKYRLVQGTVGVDLSCRVPILRHSDTLWVQFSTADTSQMKHLIEVVDVRGVPVCRFLSAAPLSQALPLSASAMFARRSFMQGVYELRYRSSRGSQLVLARIFIVGTD
jgi:hypothetical protein